MEELIARLSQVKGLRIIARTSMKYRGENKSISEIGRELKVGSILEGSVRKGGDKIRITMELVDVMTEKHLLGVQVRSGFGRHISNSE